MTDCWIAGDTGSVCDQEAVSLLTYGLDVSRSASINAKTARDLCAQPTIGIGGQLFRVPEYSLAREPRFGSPLVPSRFRKSLNPHGNIISCQPSAVPANPRPPDNAVAAAPAIITVSRGHEMQQRVFPQLRITSWNRSRTFYVDGLGFKVDWEHRFEPGFPVFTQVSRDGLCLFLTEHAGDCQPLGAAYLVVDDVDALYREISSRGIQPQGAPVDTPWGRREMVIIDPDGNRLRFANLGAISWDCAVYRNGPARQIGPRLELAPKHSQPHDRVLAGRIVGKSEIMQISDECTKPESVETQLRSQSKQGS